VRRGKDEGWGKVSGEGAKGRERWRVKDEGFLERSAGSLPGYTRVSNSSSQEPKNFDEMLLTRTNVSAQKLF